MAADGVAAADPATVALHDRLRANPLGTSAQLPEPDIRGIRGEDPLTALIAGHHIGGVRARTAQFGHWSTPLSRSGYLLSALVEVSLWLALFDGVSISGKARR